MWSSIVWWWSRRCGGRETGLSEKGPARSIHAKVSATRRCCDAVPRVGSTQKVGDTVLARRPGLVACACVSDRKRATWRDSGTVAAAWALSEPAACSMASGHSALTCDRTSRELKMRGNRPSR
eukprot:scaffold12271_cov66-Phaeocystis_antarctica.AAC.4